MTETRRNTLLGLAAIFIAWAAAIALVGLGGDFPLNDDWAYAHSARGFLHTGRMRILDWAAPSLIAHVAWGAALMRLFGESYVVLRAGTLGFALAGLFTLYGLSRRAGLSPSRAVLPPLALLASPWYLNLSFTYMSDVPWLTVLLGALYLTALSLRQDAPPRRGLLFLAGSLVATAALIRQFAVITAPAFVLLVFIDACRRSADLKAAVRQAVETALYFAVPLVAIYGVYHYWYTHIHGPTLAHRDTWKQMTAVGPSTIVTHLFCFTLYAGLWLLPVAVAVPAALRTRKQQAVGLFVLIALSAFAMIEAIRGLFSNPSAWRPCEVIKPAMPYLGNIFYDLGIGPPTLYDVYTGRAPLPHASYGFAAFLTVISICGATLMSGLALRLYASLRLTLSSLKLTSREACVRVLVAACGGFYLLWHLLTGPVIFDRYLLPALPLLWLLILAEVEKEPLKRLPLFGLLAAGLLFSAVGNREYLAWNTARAQAISDLVKSGVKVAKIDAGFEWNGTWRFEEYFKKTGTLHTPDFPWWSPHVPYHLTFSEHRECPTVGRYPFFTWPGFAQQAIYVLRCPDPPPGLGSP